MKALSKIIFSSLDNFPLHNAFDAIEHASDCSSISLELEDFEIKDLGYLNSKQLYQFDDISSWIDIEDEEDLISYRKGYFKDFDPDFDFEAIIIITYPTEERCATEIGDGRGRINFINYYNRSIKAFHMIHHLCL